MITLDNDKFNDLLLQVNIKQRLKKEFRFVTSTARLSAEWSLYELFPITDRTGDSGLLLMQPNDVLFAVYYNLSRRIVDSSTGRDRAIICDFCSTWQPGSNAASITFSASHMNRSVRLLCCADLDCSLHVRTATKVSSVSRAQLRENMTDEARVERLKGKLGRIIEQLGLYKLDV
jgi:hypothetical protein